MYKLTIISGYDRKTETRGYWMTQVGLHDAEEQFEELTHRNDVMELHLFRQDIHGTYEIRRWKRNECSCD